MQEKGKAPLADFIRYNNTVPIVISLILLSGGGAFAATNPALQAAVYDTEQSVTSVDTTYITSVNLERYPFKTRIASITEDEEWYYVSYTLDTITVVDAVWRDVTKNDVLRVNKTLLRGGNLRDYIEVEFGQLRDREYRLLKETQAYERALGVTQKTVAREYRGLIGQFVRSDADTLPAYIPPPSRQDPNDPLRVDNPTPLEGYDANAPIPEPDIPIIVSEEVERISGQPLPDACPEMPEYQLPGTVCIESVQPEPDSESPQEESIPEEGSTSGDPLPPVETDTPLFSESEEQPAEMVPPVQ